MVQKVQLFDRRRQRKTRLYTDIDGLVQDCGNSIAFAMELL